MSVLTCPEIHVMAIGEKRIISVDFTDALDAGVTLTGTPTTGVSPSGGPAIANAAVNTEAVQIKDELAAIGKAVQFSADAAGVTAATYTVTLTVTSTTTPAETIKRRVTIKVEA